MRAGGRNQIASQTDNSGVADSRKGGVAAAATAPSVLARYLRPQARRLATLAAFLIAAIGTQLISPLIVRRFIDAAAQGGAHVSLTVLWMLAVAFIAAAIVTQLLQIGATYFSEQLAWTATNALRRDLATHTLGLDMSFHTATSPGDVIERVDGDVAALANFFSQFVLQIIGGALLLIGIFVVLILADWRIGGALGAVAIVAGLTMHAMRNVARPQWERVRNAFSTFSAFLEERIAGLEDIRANGGGAHAMRRFAVINRELATANMAATRRGQWIYLVASGLFSLGFAIALAVGARLYLLHAVTIGAVFMFMQYAGMMAQPIVLIGTQLQQFQTASASLTRIRGLLALGPQLKDGPGLDWAASRKFAPKVALEHVSFAYRADAPVLRRCVADARVGNRARPAWAHRQRQDDPLAAAVPPLRPH